MKKYQHILLSTDLSEANKVAVQHADDLRKQYGAELSVILVAGVPPTYSFGMVSYEEIEQRLIDESKPHFDKFFADTGLTDFNPIIAVGSIKDEIYKTIKTHGIDLLVIGSHGQHGISEVMGSTVNAILQRVTCDVMIVHP